MQSIVWQRYGSVVICGEMQGICIAMFRHAQESHLTTRQADTQCPHIV